MKDVNSLVEIKGEKITTNSVIVSDAFNKRHDDVLKKIKTLNCSKDFRLRNFAESFRTSKTGKETKRRFKTFNITKDGFMFLVMGFNGKKAAEIKERYISAFNDMYEELNKFQKTKPASEYVMITEQINKKFGECFDCKIKEESLHYIIQATMNRLDPLDYEEAIDISLARIDDP